MAVKILECELVVLGAGGAGLVAAVKASDDGVKKVIVLEKAKNPGGATYFAHAPGVGPLMTMPGSNSASPRTLYYNWLISKVGQENIVKGERMDEFKELIDPSIGPGTGGNFTIQKMMGFCEKQGVQVLTQTRASKFVTDGSGKVKGVLAETADGEIQVNCKACVIASGGFGRNMEMLRKYWPEPYNNEELFFLCPPGMTGDGINMAEAIGAYIDQTKWEQNDAGGFFSDGPMHHPYSWAVQSIMSNASFISINLHGKRWKNEEGMGTSLSKQPGSVVYAVADAEMIETVGSRVASSGMVGPMGAAVSADSNEARAIKRWREDLEYEAAIDDQGANGNHTKKADTLVELALKMRIDPAVFAETIEKYNKFCETGKDLDFGKSTKNLKPIRKGPFYAIYGHRFSQCTKGLHGIAVNTNFEVLNPKGETMPGLWAAGDTCTIYGGLSIQFPAGERGTQATGSGGNILSATRVPGGGATAAIVSGYFAGTHAAEYLKKL
jgi:succinate dehydrogenase/fumarate reductase flavoprotein subunit